MSKEFAIITGGASGLGLEVAIRLVKKGTEICIVGRDSGHLETARTRLDALGTGVRIRCFRANIGRQQEVEALGDYLLREGARPSHLFNIAGVGSFGDTVDITEEKIRIVFEANLVGLILMSTYALKVMASLGGVIVNVMSTAALVGRPKEALYCAAKWGARGFTEALKAATKGSTIRVISVYPGGMDTPFWSSGCGLTVDTRSFMRPADVAAKIVTASTEIDSALVSDVTINRV